MGKKGKTAIHTIVLLIATLLTFFWTTNEVLARFSLQLSAILLLTLIITHHLLKPSSFKLVESTVSTIAILVITTATGGINSPLFFLNFFLLFELSFLLEPEIPFFLSFGFMLFYFYIHQAGQSPLSLLVLLSFPLITPLAYFFGKIYTKEENQKREIRNLTKKIKRLEEKLVEQEIESI